MDTHAVDSCVRGFHVYNDRWTPVLGEVIMCEVEDGNTSDTYAVAIKKGGEIIGHVPRTISAACNLFLELGGSLRCIITDTLHRYSADLPQGGLQIPCKLVFESTKKSSLVPKVRRLVAVCPPIELKLEEKRAPKRSVKVTDSSVKKRRVEDDVVDIDTFSGSNGDFVDQVGVRDGAPWLKCERQLLKITDKDMILRGSFKFTIESIVNYKYV